MRWSCYVPLDGTSSCFHLSLSVWHVLTALTPRLQHAVTTRDDCPHMHFYYFLHILHISRVHFPCFNCILHISTSLHHFNDSYTVITYVSYFPFLVSVSGCVRAMTWMLHNALIFFLRIIKYLSVYLSKDTFTVTYSKKHKYVAGTCAHVLQLMLQTKEQHLLYALYVINDKKYHSSLVSFLYIHH